MDTTGGSPHRSNPLGLASAVTGVIALLLAAFAQAIAQIVPWLLVRSGFSPFAEHVAIGGPSAAIGALAVALGIIGLRVPGRPRAAAIVGTTLGASHLIVGLSRILGSGIVAAVFS